MSGALLVRTGGGPVVPPHFASMTEASKPDNGGGPAGLSWRQRRCSPRLGSVVHGGHRPSSQHPMALSAPAIPLLVFVNADPDSLSPRSSNAEPDRRPGQTAPFTNRGRTLASFEAGGSHFRSQLDGATRRPAFAPATSISTTRSLVSDCVERAPRPSPAVRSAQRRRRRSRLPRMAGKTSAPTGCSSGAESGGAR
jgi:hypothetical protein